jgi:hypothetical protein
MKRSLLILLFIVINSNFSLANSYAIENLRRRPQFGNGFSYAVLPLPYKIPGLGEGVAIGMTLNNIYETDLDIAALGILGDVEGCALGVTDFYLIPERFYLNIGASYISKATFLINPSRGMKGDEDPDDFYSAELGDSSGAGLDATITFLNRMVDFNYSFYSTDANIKSIRDKDGNVLIDTEDSDNERGHILGAGFLLDLTDDRKDPRVGFRFNISANMPLDVEDDSVENYVVDINTTVFFPILKQSTIVLNYFHSDSHVISEGLTDRDQIINNNDLSVTSGDTEAENARDEVVDNIVSENKYGSASSLGGLSRLRSFTEMRFRGAHTRFAGVEFRYNLTDEKTPFNIWLVKDVRTSFQIAFFHEAGTIADREGELYDEIKHSTGIGFRMVVSSGFVFRLDIATGSEGEEVSLFFDYPWTFL